MEHVRSKGSSFVLCSIPGWSLRTPNVGKQRAAGRVILPVFQQLWCGRNSSDLKSVTPTDTIVVFCQAPDQFHTVCESIFRVEPWRYATNVSHSKPKPVNTTEAAPPGHDVSASIRRWKWDRINCCLPLKPRLGENSFCAGAKMHFLKAKSRKLVCKLAPHLAEPSPTPPIVDFHPMHPLQWLIMTSFSQAGRLH